MVFEIKCPASIKSLRQYYISEAGNINAKCVAQLQLQMHLCQKKKGIFCVAKPDFEHSPIIENLIIKDVTYNKKYCLNLFENIKNFWEKAIYIKLQNQYCYECK